MLIENKRKVIITVVILLIIGILFAIYLFMNNYTYEEINFNEIFEEDINITNESIENNETEQEIEIAVHVTGEVKKQGLIYVKQGARVADAIEKAGGETSEADLSQINLAYILEDGQKIYIPNKNEKISQYITKNNGNNENNNTDKEDKKVNINTASQSELDELPGIGPSTAQKIIEYREENGNFETIEDVQNVKGIGDAKFEEIKDKITV